MLSKSQLSFVKSLHLKKFRKQHHLFLVEGDKSIAEFLSSDFILSQLFYTPEMASKMAIFPHKMKHIAISSLELAKISTLKNPSGTLAIFEMPKNIDIELVNFKNRFSLVLDAVQDPGNLGTIIRTADWFGIEHILCSLDTTDCYNPKVVQATMGSLARVSLHYIDIEEWIPQANIKTYGALLNGLSLYESGLGSKQTSEGFIVLGNEGHGIRQKVLTHIDQAITIPCFGNAESLNVAIATALICSELRRNGT